MAFSYHALDLVFVLGILFTPISTSGHISWNVAMRSRPRRFMLEDEALINVALLLAAYITMRDVVVIAGVSKELAMGKTPILLRFDTLKAVIAGHTFSVY